MSDTLARTRPAANGDNVRRPGALGRLLGVRARVWVQGGGAGGGRPRHRRHGRDG